MTIFLQNVASQVLDVFMVATDHFSGATGRTPILYLSKNGATGFASATETPTEMKFGWYKFTLASGSVDTTGEFAVHATATSADESDQKHQIVAYLPANVTQWATGAVPAPNVVGRPLVDVTHYGGTAGTFAAGRPEVNTTNVAGGAVNALVAGRMDSSVGAMAANVLTATAINAAALNGKGDWNIGKTGYALSAAGVQAIWDALTTALTVASSIGKLLVDNINATISGRAAAGDAMALTVAERNSVADALLDRDMATGTDSGSAVVRTVRQALRFLRNKWSISGTTLTVTKENDDTASWTGTVTTDSNAVQITANDPA